MARVQIAMATGKYTRSLLYMCTCIYNMDNMYHMDEMYHMLCIYLTGNESGSLTRVLIGSDEFFESSDSIFPRK